MIAELARELEQLGHRPTVFATGDSTCAGARKCLFDEPVWPPDDLAELRHSAAAWKEIAEDVSGFDVVHVNHPNALPFGRFISASAGIPVVATAHHDRVASFAAHYAAYPEVSFVAISERQANLSWEVQFDAVIHHGLDCERYPYGDGGAQIAFLGRLAAEKAPHLALDCARSAGAPLVIGGAAHPPDREYFEREVRPRLDCLREPRARWLGEVNHEQKVELLRESSCLAFPIQWEEPFGLVMIEAMLVGTPVVALACGAAPEVVEDGVTGFLAYTEEEFCRRLREVKSLDRKRCRERARERWSANRMARDYVALYERLIQEGKEKLDHGATVRMAAAVGE